VRADVAGNLPPYKTMWLITMFDVPMQTPADRRNYTRLQKGLLKAGFLRLQFSIYARWCESEDSAKVLRKIVRSILAPGGEVRIVMVTERQFTKMEVFIGRKKKPAEAPPEQFQLW
jgi:CRISPR-associated protein Cas2